MWWWLGHLSKVGHIFWFKFCLLHSVCHILCVTFFVSHSVYHIYGSHCMGHIVWVTFCGSHSVGLLPLITFYGSHFTWQIHKFEVQEGNLWQLLHSSWLCHSQQGWWYRKTLPANDHYGAALLPCVVWKRFHTQLITFLVSHAIIRQAPHIWASYKLSIFHHSNAFYQFLC